MVSGFLIFEAFAVPAALVLTVATAIPAMWYGFAVAVPLIVLHTAIAEPFGRGGPFWWYFYERFGFGRLSYLPGLALFAALTAALIGLAVWGFLYCSAFALGALFGAWLADGSLSHVLPRVLFKGPNPGLWTGVLYLIAAPAGLCLFPVTTLGFVAGAAPFVAFWSVSFALRAAPQLRERIMERRERLRTIAKWAAAILIPAVLGAAGGMQMAATKTVPVVVPVVAPLPLGADASPIDYEGCRFHGDHDDHGPQRLEAQAARWPSDRITYSIDYASARGMNPPLSDAAIQGEARIACGWWAEHLQLEFVEVPHGTPGTNVPNKFERIDGPGGVLAEAYLADGTSRPKPLRLDISERWVAGPPAANQVALRTVWCHEIGHSLGLPHDAQNALAVMRPTYTASIPREQESDIASAVGLGYKRRVKAPPPATDVLSFPVQVRTDDVIQSLQKAGYQVTKP